MNWLENWIDKIQNASTSETIPTSAFFIKMNGESNRRQMSKIMECIIHYDSCVKSLKISNCDENSYLTELINRTNEITDKLKKIKVKNVITINRLIELSLGLSTEVGASKNRNYDPSKYTRKILNLLYKIDKNKFLINFKCK